MLFESNKLHNSSSEQNNYISELIRSHNILIQGKSGSGKTEIIKQTAKICDSPFIKVDAVRYTEVGYFGDDVENIITNLYTKTKREFEGKLEKLFWEVDSVKKSWESFILSYILGNNYLKHPSYTQYSDLLHKGEIDLLEINLWLHDLDKVVKYTIKEIKEHFWSVTKYRLENQVSNILNQIVKYRSNN